MKWTSVYPADFERAGKIGDPGGRPVAGNLCTAGMVVRVNEDDAHD